MKKIRLLSIKLLQVLILLLILGPGLALAAWTVNSISVTSGGDFFDYQVVDITIDLTSDGDAATAIDIWAEIVAGGTTAQRRLLRRGGLFYTLYYQQGTDAPDNDFLLTFYDGVGFEIFSETIDYDQAGLGSLVGGSYAADSTRGQYLPLRGGLTAAIADIGASGDDIILIISIVRPRED